MRAPFPLAHAEEVLLVLSLPTLFSLPLSARSLFLLYYPPRRRPERTPSAPVDFRNASSSGHFVETCRQLHRRVRAVESSDDFPLRCWVFLDSLPLRGEILLRHGPLRISLPCLPRTLVIYLDAWCQEDDIFQGESASKRFSSPMWNHCTKCTTHFGRAECMNLDIFPLSNLPNCWLPLTYLIALLIYSSSLP